MVVEVWKIDGSRPAPHFNSDRALRYQAFFRELMDALRERGFTNARKAQLQSWYYFSAGHAQRVQYGATFAQEKRARIEVYIDNTDRDWNKILFDRLMERKESIESELSESLEWEHLDDRRMIHNLLDFKRVFGPRLDELATDHRPSPVSQ